MKKLFFLKMIIILIIVLMNIAFIVNVTITNTDC
jgi:hypothetical protein